ncbi:MAG: peptide-methionine (S)-S-oxide reductase MsrA, partial [Candidatus Acidiferrum sp.]
MRPVFFGILILAGLGVLAWATAKPNDGRANAKAAFPKPAVDAPISATKGQETAVVSGGCFWGIQGVYQHVKGVLSATSGYSGGEASTAHYEDVSTGSTGHAESVKIVFDPSQISYGQILMIFFSVGHNPTELNYQGPDHGTQYRSSIFYSNEQQKKIAEAYVDQLGTAKVYSQSIVTQVVPLKGFYPAEDYHQDYL